MGLNTLLRLRRRVQAEGGRLVLTGLQVQSTEVMRLTETYAPSTPASLSCRTEERPALEPHSSGPGGLGQGPVQECPAGAALEVTVARGGVQNPAPAGNAVSSGPGRVGVWPMPRLPHGRHTWRISRSEYSSIAARTSSVSRRVRPQLPRWSSGCPSAAREAVTVQDRSRRAASRRSGSSSACRQSSADP
ncbi:hypothetical protein [Streptomyces sp. NPDC126503]|uniref:hypothetical protein n=1 Tax=Streptomyces sp. NPDC126503 TaxID=3155315 RepID=UPI00332FC5D8